MGGVACNHQPAVKPDSQMTTFLQCCLYTCWLSLSLTHSYSNHNCTYICMYVLYICLLGAHMQIDVSHRAYKSIRKHVISPCASLMGIQQGSSRHITNYPHWTENNGVYGIPNPSLNISCVLAGPKPDCVCVVGGVSQDQINTSRTLLICGWGALLT